MKAMRKCNDEIYQLAKDQALVKKLKSVFFVRSLLCPFILLLNGWTLSPTYSADVTVKEVNHIRCFAIDIAKDDLYSFPVVLLWNTCACCNWRQHLQCLSPHGLHWPTVDEGLILQL
jgi:hypothetical protein